MIPSTSGFTSRSVSAVREAYHTATQVVGQHTEDIRLIWAGTVAQFHSAENRAVFILYRIVSFLCPELSATLVTIGEKFFNTAAQLGSNFRIEGTEALMLRQRNLELLAKTARRMSEGAVAQRDAAVQAKLEMQAERDRISQQVNGYIARTDHLTRENERLNTERNSANANAASATTQEGIRHQENRHLDEEIHQTLSREEILRRQTEESKKKEAQASAERDTAVKKGTAAKAEIDRLKEALKAEEKKGVFAEQDAKLNANLTNFASAFDAMMQSGRLDEAALAQHMDGLIPILQGRKKETLAWLDELMGKLPEHHPSYIPLLGLKGVLDSDMAVLDMMMKISAIIQSTPSSTSDGSGVTLEEILRMSKEMGGKS